MKRTDFLDLLNKNAKAVSELLGVTLSNVYAWRKNGVPLYWWGAVNRLTNRQVKNIVEKIDKQKLANARKRGRR